MKVESDSQNESLDKRLSASSPSSCFHKNQENSFESFEINSETTTNDSSRNGAKHHKVNSHNSKVIRDIIQSYIQCSSYAKRLDHRTSQKFLIQAGMIATMTRANTWRQYSIEMEKDLKAILPFVCDTDDTLSARDQEILLKRSAFSIYLLRCCRTTTALRVYLPSAHFMDMETLKILYGTHLANKVFKFLDLLLEMGTSEKDIAMFTTIILFQDLPTDQFERLENPKGFKDAQKKFGLLFYEYASRRKMSNGKNNFITLLGTLSQLKAINELFRETISFLEQYHWLFPADSLFAEVYDIRSFTPPEVTPEYREREDRN